MNTNNPLNMIKDLPQEVLLVAAVVIIILALWFLTKKLGNSNSSGIKLNANSIRQLRGVLEESSDPFTSSDVKSAKIKYVQNQANELFLVKIDIENTNAGKHIHVVYRPHRIEFNNGSAEKARLHEYGKVDIDSNSYHTYYSPDYFAQPKEEPFYNPITLLSREKNSAYVIFEAMDLPEVIENGSVDMFFKTDKSNNIKVSFNFRKNRDYAEILKA